MTIRNSSVLNDARRLISFADLSDGAESVNIREIVTTVGRLSISLVKTTNAEGDVISFVRTTVTNANSAIPQASFDIPEDITVESIQSALQEKMRLPGSLSPATEKEKDMYKISHGVIGDREDGEPVSLEEFIASRQLESLAIPAEIQALIDNPTELSKLVNALGMSDSTKE